MKPLFFLRGLASNWRPPHYEEGKERESAPGVACAPIALPAPHGVLIPNLIRL